MCHRCLVATTVWSGGTRCATRPNRRLVLINTVHRPCMVPFLVPRMQPVNCKIIPVKAWGTLQTRSEILDSLCGAEEALTGFEGEK